MKSEEFKGRSAEMKKSTLWLASEDLLGLGEVTVAIEKVYKHIDAELNDGRKETVFALKFEGAEKQLILNATNRKELVRFTGSGDAKDWVGKKVALFVVSGVRKPGGSRGETTTGIRLRGVA